jgi:galactokinase
MDRRAQVLKAFKDKFGDPKIEVQSPGRANIIGEHTDYNKGFVLPFTINKKLWFFATLSNDIDIVALDINESYNSKVKSKSSWNTYIDNIIIQIEGIINCKIGASIVFGGNLPIGAGISSSSALCCGLVEVFDKLYNLNLTQGQKIEIASKTEIGSGVLGGIMDQSAIFLGLKNKALLLDCLSNSHSYVLLPSSWKFILLNTNVNHNLLDSPYNNRRETCEQIFNKLNKNSNINSFRDLNKNQLKTLKQPLEPIEYKMAEYILEENKRVLHMVEAIQNNDIILAGELLYNSHLGLSKKYRVSCDELDFVVNKCSKHKYIKGARMMGAGFGGCVIVLLDKNDYENIILKNIWESYYAKFQKSLDIIEIESGDGIKFKLI